MTARWHYIAAICTAFGGLILAVLLSDWTIPTMVLAVLWVIAGDVRRIADRLDTLRDGDDDTDDGEEEEVDDAGEEEKVDPVDNVHVLRGGK